MTEITDERLAELIELIDGKGHWVLDGECLTTAALRELQSSRRDAARYRKLRRADQSGAFIAVKMPHSAVAHMTGLYADECVDRSSELPESTTAG